MIKTVSVGLIGCGRIAEIAHLPAYQVVKKAQLVAVADTKAERAKWVAERFGIKNHYLDPMEIIERKDIDAVDICLPTFLHSKFITAAAGAGKHVLCEKPMALNVKEAENTISRAKKSGIKLMVGYNQRFEKPFKKIKDFIDSDMLGNLVSLEVKYARCESTERYLPPNWRAYPTMGGGALLDSASHKIDLLRWFGGEVRRVSTIKAHFLKTEAEDTTCMILEFEKGAIGYLGSSLICASPYKELDLTKVYGSKGTVWYGPHDKQALQIYLKGALLGRTSGFITLKTPSKKSSYVLELEAFINSIINEDEPPITGEDAKKVLQILEAAHESAKTGKTITLSH